MIPEPDWPEKNLRIALLFKKSCLKSNIKSGMWETMNKKIASATLKFFRGILKKRITMIDVSSIEKLLGSL